MNCRPGDIAVVIGGSKYAVKLVEVLYEAPNKTFRLPDGYLNEGCIQGYWVIKSLGALFDAPVGDGFRQARFGTGPDSKLRPIRPGELDEPIDADIKKPDEVAA